MPTERGLRIESDQNSFRQRGPVESASNELLARLRTESASGTIRTAACESGDAHESGPPPSPPDGNPDWLLGAEAISGWISLHYFKCSERKVYYLFERTGSRPGGPGFFKLSGTLALSKSAFAAWAKAKTGGARS
jgi:hypothetical protein